MGKLEPQPYPEASKCPACDGEPTPESKAKHQLANMGYLHDDALYECSEPDCNRNWTVGRPIGDYDKGRDLWCNSCDEGFMRVHRVEVQHGDLNQFVLHLKCPNHNSFDCPGCDETIATVRHHDDGTPLCPWCGEEFDRHDLPGCFHFKRVRRNTDNDDIALVGYPDITGSTKGAEPYGYPDDDDE